MILTGIWLKTGAALPLTGMILMAFAGNISPIYVALLKESNCDYRFGTVVCVGNSFAYAVSAVFSGCAGRLMDVYQPEIVDNIRVYSRESYMLVFGVLTLLGAVSAVLSLMIKESYGKNISGDC